MNRIGDNAVLCGLLRGGHDGGAKPNAAFRIWANPPGDDQSRTAGCAFGIKGGHTFEPMLRFLKAQMHGAHDHSVFQLRETQIKGLKKMRIMGVGHRDLKMCDANRSWGLSYDCKRSVTEDWDQSWPASVKTFRAARKHSKACGTPQ